MMENSDGDGGGRFFSFEVMTIADCLSLPWCSRGVNHLLEISGNLYNKSEISYALGRIPSEKWEISYAKFWSDLPLDF